MGKKKAGRVACRALEYVEPVHPPDMESMDAVRRHLLDSTVGSPARSSIEARSDLAFVDDIVKALVTAGLDDAQAWAATAAVLATPTLAAQKSDEADTIVLQSIVLARPRTTANRSADCNAADGADDPDDSPDDSPDAGADDHDGADGCEMQIVVRLRARGGKPPVVELIEADVAPFDLTDRAELLALVAMVETWMHEFPMPNHVFPIPLPLPEWAWLGDLTWAGLLELPADWREQIRRIGGVYGRPPLIAESAESARQSKVGARSGFVIATPSVKWAAGVHIPADSGREIETIGAEAMTFADLLTELRDLIHEKAAAANAPLPPSRELEKSETVYHRKIGNSRAFDRFDEGTTKPCRHGAGSFTGWSGDKATKGMARRYDNFTSEMLIHCAKYPNCNVYGVSAARGGLKSREDDESAGPDGESTE